MSKYGVLTYKKEHPVQPVRLGVEFVPVIGESVLLLRIIIMSPEIFWKIWDWF